MVDKANAIKIAQEYFEVISRDQDYHLVLREDKIIEKEYGWIIPSITQEYLDRDPRYVVDGVLLHLIGGYPIVAVEHESGSLYPLDTSYSFESAIADYEARRFFNFTGLFYDLTIRLVRDLEKTLEFLARVSLCYDTPRRTDTGGEIIMPCPYKREQLRELLGQLPVTFHHQRIRHHYRVFQDMDVIGCCEYDLVPSENQQSWFDLAKSQLRGDVPPSIN